MVDGGELYEGGWVGKLPQETLEQVVLSKARRFSWASTLMGPAIGEDAALIDLGNCVLAAHSDPITESRFRVGSLAVDVASNDVAVRGVRPQWMIVDVLMPAGSLLSSLSAIIDDVVTEAQRLGIELVGGHTEAAPGISHPIVVVTVMGCGERGHVIMTGAASEGDLLLQVGPTAMEATAIIANDFRDLLVDAGLSEDYIAEASRLIERASVAHYALALAERGLVTSMHDVTEGGLIGAVYELARASGHDVTVNAEAVIVEDVTRIIFSRLGADPLKAMGSGSFIAALRPNQKDEALGLLKELGVKASVIGRVEGSSSKPRLKLLRGSSVEEYISPPEDEVARLWSARAKSHG